MVATDACSVLPCSREHTSDSSEEQKHNQGGCCNLLRALPGASKPFSCPCSLGAARGVASCVVLSPCWWLCLVLPSLRQCSAVWGRSAAWWQRENSPKQMPFNSQLKHKYRKAWLLALQLGVRLRQHLLPLPMGKNITAVLTAVPVYI